MPDERPDSSRTLAPGREARPLRIMLSGVARAARVLMYVVPVAVATLSLAMQVASLVSAQQNAKPLALLASIVLAVPLQAASEAANYWVFFGCAWFFARYFSVVLERKLAGGRVVAG
jgi:hypothetical protein